MLCAAGRGPRRAAGDSEQTAFAPGTEFGQAGAYEKLRGRAWFALDPEAAANAPIADLKLAPRNNRGLVIFSAEFLVLRPVDAARGNGMLLYEVNNRGNIGILRQLNSATTGSNDPSIAADAGNGFLFRQGFTLVWSSWAADVADDTGRQADGAGGARSPPIAAGRSPARSRTT